MSGMNRSQLRLPSFPSPRNKPGLLCVSASRPTFEHGEQTPQPDGISKSIIKNAPLRQIRCGHVPKQRRKFSHTGLSYWSLQGHDRRHNWTWSSSDKRPVPNRDLPDISSGFSSFVLPRGAENLPAILDTGMSYHELFPTPSLITCICVHCR